ncbi:MAG: mercury(II) reductase [Calditrichaeota bacterium]|nr:mercury(II) reductase [Calditrichota bacterium]
MTCDECARHVREALSDVPGVQHVEVQDWRMGRAEVVADLGVSEEDLVRAVREAGYSATVQPENETARPALAKDGADVDLLVIGAGSAGFAAAIKAAELGRSVTLVESGTIGGTCVNVGCVPSKTLIRALGVYHLAAHHGFRGVNTVAGALSWPELLDQKDALVQELRQSKYVDVLKAYPAVTYVQGRACFRDAATVEIGGSTLRPRRVILATGARLWLPPIPGLREVNPLTSTTAMSLRELPRSLIVLGGNAVGLELAQVFARAGSAVTVVELMDQIAPAEDEEISQALAGYLEMEGVRVLTGVTTERVERRDGRVVLRGKGRNGEKIELAAQELLVATGRRPNTEGLGLENAGIRTDDRGGVVVDRFLRTTNPAVYAAGDVIGRNMFVYVAAYAGGLAAENALAQRQTPFEPGALPRVTFTDPQIASVGLTEREALTAGYQVKSVTLPLAYVPKALTARDTRGLIKLVANSATDRLLGAHILAADAGEVIQIAVLALKFGITVKQLTQTLFPYLTLAEGIKLAALSFEKDVTKLSCCAG